MSCKSLAALMMGAFLLAACGGGGGDNSSGDVGDGDQQNSQDGGKKDADKSGGANKDGDKKESDWSSDDSPDNPKDGKDDCDLDCKVSQKLRIELGSRGAIEINGKIYKDGIVDLRDAAGNSGEVLPYSEKSSTDKRPGMITVGNYVAAWNVEGKHEARMFPSSMKEVQSALGGREQVDYKGLSLFSADETAIAEFNLAVDMKTRTHKGKISNWKLYNVDTGEIDGHRGFDSRFPIGKGKSIEFSGSEFAEDADGVYMSSTEAERGEDGMVKGHKIYFAGPQAEEVVGALTIQNKGEEAQISLLGQQAFKGTLIDSSKLLIDHSDLLKNPHNVK